MRTYPGRGLHGQVVESLGRRIVGGELAEGTTLDVVGLTGQLEVSLTALRESLKVLSAKGLVGAKPKRGTYVELRSHWDLLDGDVLRWQADHGGDDRSFLDNLNEVRLIIEPAAARLAAARRSDADLATLEECLATMAGAVDAPSAVEADLRFHRALLASTQNELLVRMEVLIREGLAERDRLVHAGQAQNPVPAHRRVLKALRAADPEAAEAAMRALLDTARRDLERTRRRRYRAERPAPEEAHECT